MNAKGEIKSRSLLIDRKEQRISQIPLPHHAHGENTRSALLTWRRLDRCTCCRLETTRLRVSHPPLQRRETLWGRRSGNRCASGPSRTPALPCLPESAIQVRHRSFSTVPSTKATR